MKLNSISYCVYFYKVFYVWNNFLTPFNSHFMRMPIIAIIEFLGIAVAFSIISEFMYHSVYNTGKGREYLHPSLKVKGAE